MSGITRETRRESISKVNRQKRGELILEALGNEEMTAREIARKLHFTDLNSVRPRLTEMAAAGRIEVCGKEWDVVTERTVAVYRKRDEQKYA